LRIAPEEKMPRLALLIALCLLWVMLGSPGAWSFEPPESLQEVMKEARGLPARSGIKKEAPSIPGQGKGPLEAKEPERIVLPPRVVYRTESSQVPRSPFFLNAIIAISTVLNIFMAVLLYVQLKRPSIPEESAALEEILVPVLGLDMTKYDFEVLRKGDWTDDGPSK
jgi:hypothetical protein